MAAVITLMVVALAAGYIGARIERRRSSSITMREADRLINSVAEMRKVFDRHIEVHKIIKHDIEILDQNVAAIGRVVGMEQSRSLH